MKSKKPTDLGRNRSGMAVAPLMAKQMAECTRLTRPSSDGDDAALCQVRTAYAAEAAPIGTMPPPATLKGLGKTALKMLKGEKPTVFLDKLGERLAFERTGTRLYQALVCRFDVFGEIDGGPQSVDLKRFLAEEAEHFELVRQAILAAGGDPTAVTPCADVAAVSSLGILQLLTDPRTSPAQCLQAILVAELTDHDGWALLVELADGLGHVELTEKFRRALAEEENHLGCARDWLAGSVMAEARLGGLELARRNRPRRELRSRGALAHPSEEAETDNAIEMLTAQHRRAEDLFTRLERAGNGNRHALFLELADSLTIHFEIEERHFYPAAEAGTDTASEVQEAHKEQAEMKGSLAQLLQMDSSGDGFQERIEELRETFEHHVEEVENELFPRCAEEMEPEQLEAVGQEMLATMVELESGEPRARIVQESPPVR